MSREKYWRQEAIQAKSQLEEGNQIWRNRAMYSAEAHEATKKKLDAARKALGEIVHMGHVGDSWVDTACHALEATK